MGEAGMKSNSELQRDVQNELNWSHSMTAAGIGVTAQAGVITLTGNVPSYFEKVEAEHIAGRVAGVMAIADELKVNLPAFSERTDADIAQTVLSALAWNVAVPRDQAKVVVENGWVTLTGQVDWYYQKMAAENAVHHLMGVKGVTNTITLKLWKTASAAEIEGSIENAFKRHARLGAQNITVTVHNGTATLQGKAHSWEDKEAAGQSALAAPGISSVENNIVVTN
jgi:osmotically-inducible protein OsmY